jgi:deoxyribonuclease-4
MHLLGAHMSMAGGYYKAVNAAAENGMQVVQLFTKNNNQWRAKPISDEDIRQFKEAMSSTGITHPLSHASYLLNLASGKEELWKRSVEGLMIELVRAEQLGIPYVVLHPGAYVDGLEEEGIARIVKGLDEVHRDIRSVGAKVLLETTAGQGTNLGWRFEQLGAMIQGVRRPEKLGVCFDTCHVFAAGYAMETAEQYQETMQKLDQHVGLERVKAFHLNDSKKPLGSRVDRHEHIGQGELGLAPFEHLMNDSRFTEVPMYLETPKGDKNDETNYDKLNLATLRGMVR